MSLKNLDWNLLPALEVLLEEQNVSRAARRLGVTQPAASSALARLRRHFDDELLVRDGNRYALTPFALRLFPLVQEAVASTRAVLDGTRHFDPQASAREFVVATTEFGQLVVGPRLVEAVSRLAPGVQVRFCSPFVPGHAGTADLLSRFSGGWIAPHELFGNLPTCGSVPDRWVAVVRRQHPFIEDVVTEEQARAASWVFPTVPGRSNLQQLDHFPTHEIEPRGVVASETFGAIPFLVSRSDRIGIVQESVGRLFIEQAGARLVPCGWPMPPLRHAFGWHPSLEHDPAHAWFRGVVDRCLSDVSPDS